MDFALEECPVFEDERGHLAQVLTQSFLTKSNLKFGQVYYLDFKQKGVIRGNHYHKHSAEIFCLIHGSVFVILEEVTTKERITIDLSVQQGKYRILKIGPNIAHSLQSVSDYAMMICFSSAEFKENDEDKFSYRLL